MSAPRRADRTPVELELAEQFSSRARSPAARKAFRVFENRGLPGRRVESWHYTDLRSALTSAAPAAAAPDAARIAEARALLSATPSLAPTRLVVLDGHFLPELSGEIAAGSTLSEGAPNLELKDGDDPVLALAGALAAGGFSLETQDEADLGRVEIVHISRPGVSSASHLSFYFLPNARGCVIERAIGAGAGAQRHRLTTFALAEGARVEHVIALCDAADLDLESQDVSLEAGAEFRSFALVSGGKLTRRQVFARLTGSRAKISLAGLSLLEGTRKADTTLEVTHAAVGGESREFFRHIVADEATGTFQGKVIVAPHAQKTDGGMKSQAILLSPTATMNNKPELEIFADDVVCGHGATVGALDPEPLFYLQARGIPKPEAEAMLLEAFGAEAVERIGDPEVAAAVAALASEWLRGRSS
jgi:Fe-S cluster assembly protein SufD